MLVKSKLLKKNKLRTKSEFKNFREIPTIKTYSRYFVVYHSQNLEDHKKIGLSVSKKCGNAVQRNKIKRLIRERFRISFNLPITILFVAKSQIKSLINQKHSNRTITDDINEVIEKIENKYEARSK